MADLAYFRAIRSYHLLRDTKENHKNSQDIFYMMKKFEQINFNSVTRRWKQKEIFV